MNAYASPFSKGGFRRICQLPNPLPPSGEREEERFSLSPGGEGSRVRGRIFVGEIAQRATRQLVYVQKRFDMNHPIDPDPLVGNGRLPQDTSSDAQLVGQAWRSLLDEKVRRPRALST